MFPSGADGFGHLLDLVEKTVGIYNHNMAENIEGVEAAVGSTEAENQPSPLAIDLSKLEESAESTTKEQVSYLVDMAKADALDLLGENGQALELVERFI